MHAHPANAHRRGFSLLELLVVIGLAVILMTLAGYGINGIMKSAQITQAGQMVIDVSGLGRQEAVRNNREVQVLFLNLPRESGGGSAWRGLLLRSVDETVDGAVEREISKVYLLPPGVVLNEEEQYSPLLTADAGVKGTLDIAGYTDVPYQGFRVRPGGGLDKSITPSNNFVTLQRIGETGLPDNWYTVQINPVTGVVRTYRP